MAFLLTPESFAPVFAPLTENGAPPIYTQSSLLSPDLAHLLLVFVAAVASTPGGRRPGHLRHPARRGGVPAAVAGDREYRPDLPAGGGAGARGADGRLRPTPTLIALFLYGLLPIFENTLSGLAEVPPTVLEAATGMGMSDRQRLVRVELPLALPVILEGIRLSLVINLGTATIGSTVAAKGLGEVIIAGLLSDNTAFILQGGLVVGLMAVLLYDAMNAAEGRITRFLGLPPRRAA